jgi:hypothetical protein
MIDLKKEKGKLWKRKTGQFFDWRALISLSVIFC